MRPVAVTSLAALMLANQPHWVKSPPAPPRPPRYAFALARLRRPGVAGAVLA